MTRANIIIVTGQGKFKLQANSSAYPSHLGSFMFDFIKGCATINRGVELKNDVGFYEPNSFELGSLITNCGLSLGSVGNFDYVYEFDFIKRTFKVWESRLSWVNAPEDWKEKGWNCWQGKNGKYGYTNWVKGKKIFDVTFYVMVINKIDRFEINPSLLEIFEKK